MSKKSKRRADERREYKENREDELYGVDVDQLESFESRVTERLATVELLDQAEVNRLLNASDAPYKGPKRDPNTVPYLTYPTYTQYDCLALLNDKPIDKKPSRRK